MLSATGCLLLQPGVNSTAVNKYINIKFFYLMHRTRNPVSQKILRCPIKIKNTKFLRKIIGVFPRIQTNTYCKKIAKTLSITADSTCSDHCALKWCSSSSMWIDHSGIGLLQSSSERRFFSTTKPTALAFACPCDPQVLCLTSQKHDKRT